MNIEQARFNMIEQQIRTWDVLDQSVLSLLAVVKREDFVPAAHRGMAFMDMMIPLKDNGSQGRTMLEPKLEARLLQELAVGKHEKVLEIGAGSGYMAALLAHKAQRVLSLEIDPELARTAADNLKRAAVMNAEVRHADGSKGALAEGPFDVILASGSVASVPQQLLDQLKVGGRLAAVVGHDPIMRAVVVTRIDQNAFRTVEVFDTLAPRLLGFGEPPKFSF
ncbi:protein-L-isoaspartate O-methyltransferase family protein [Caldimonas brevitalea]|uniref:Protein-L-isoaspartate O-methyltransferase n=1 Tax=Caldimonas brevitalea TaxID=413882 RepID=A0A0G3BG74_9BURK|nr:protein-L-isoaspartate O-methyltransferase [Caldimonas brevitalea]AKJ28302.1 protein-L-isoaspartate O-methyltransferase [Caldimonas brevitalea]